MKIASVGECMLELSGGKLFEGTTPAMAKISYGGDTLNTAIYLARLGSASAFVSSVGSDVASRWMISDWMLNGVDTRWVEVDPERSSGAYLITTDVSGERSFLYWRRESAASRFLDSDAKLHALVKNLRNVEWLYFSGITLGILDNASRARFFRLVENLKRKGTKVAFDGNYRPQLWNNAEEARESFQMACQLSNACLPTLDDEQALFDDPDKDALVDRLLGYGIDEIAVKMGALGCYVATEGVRRTVPGKKVTVVDTTAAGDSFNAAYLHHRMAGESAVESARQGNELAAMVIQHRGALMPELSYNLNGASAN